MLQGPAAAREASNVSWATGQQSGSVAPGGGMGGWLRSMSGPHFGDLPFPNNRSQNRSWGFDPSRGLSWTDSALAAQAPLAPPPLAPSFGAPAAGKGAHAQAAAARLHHMMPDAYRGPSWQGSVTMDGSLGSAAPEASGEGQQGAGAALPPWLVDLNAKQRSQLISMLQTAPAPPPPKNTAPPPGPTAPPPAKPSCPVPAIKLSKKRRASSQIVGGHQGKRTRAAGVVKGGKGGIPAAAAAVGGHPLALKRHSHAPAENDAVLVETTANPLKGKDAPILNPGVRGVSWNKSAGKWQAYSRRLGEGRARKHLGYFDDIHQAAAKVVVVETAAGLEPLPPLPNRRPSQKAIKKLAGGSTMAMRPELVQVVAEMLQNTGMQVVTSELEPQAESAKQSEPSSQRTSSARSAALPPTASRSSESSAGSRISGSTGRVRLRLSGEAIVPSVPATVDLASLLPNKHPVRTASGAAVTAIAAAPEAPDGGSDGGGSGDGNGHWPRRVKVAVDTRSLSVVAQATYTSYAPAETATVQQGAGLMSTSTSAQVHRSISYSLAPPPESSPHTPSTHSAAPPPPPTVAKTAMSGSSRGGGVTGVATSSTPSGTSSSSASKLAVHETPNVTDSTPMQDTRRTGAGFPPVSHEAGSAGAGADSGFAAQGGPLPLPPFNSALDTHVLAQSVSSEVLRVLMELLGDTGAATAAAAAAAAATAAVGVSQAGPTRGGGGAHSTSTGVSVQDRAQVLHGIFEEDADRALV